MFFTDSTDYALITIFGDHGQAIEKTIGSALDRRNYKILTPADTDTLLAAAQNSALTIIGVSGPADPHLLQARRIKDHRSAACIILGVDHGQADLPPIQALSRGFDAYLGMDDLHDPAFKTYLTQALAEGSRRVNSLVQDVEFRRMCDALSCAPASMMIFDPDKRVIFISDHYYRAYPRIAPRLVRGLSVYDAFDLMAREEGLAPDDIRYERLQAFWHNMEGSIEFTLDNGTSYRMKAARLPSRGGTVVVGQNITDYHFRENMIVRQLDETKAQLAQIESDLQDNSHTMKALAQELRAHIRQGEENDSKEISTLEDLINAIEESFQ